MYNLFRTQAHAADIEAQQVLDSDEARIRTDETVLSRHIITIYAMHTLSVCNITVGFI